MAIVQRHIQKTCHTLDKRAVTCGIVAVNFGILNGQIANHQGFSTALIQCTAFQKRRIQMGNHMTSTVDGQTGVIGRSCQQNGLPAILGHIDIGIDIDGHAIQKFGICGICQCICQFLCRLNNKGHILVAANRGHTVFDDDHLTCHAVGFQTPNQIRFVDLFQSRRNDLGNALGLTIDHIYLTNACRTQHRTDTHIRGIGGGQFGFRHRAILQARICSGIRAGKADKTTDRARTLKMTFLDRTVVNSHKSIDRILSRLGVTLGNTDKSTDMLSGYIGIDQMTTVNHHSFHGIRALDQSTCSGRILALNIGVIHGQFADCDACTRSTAGKQRGCQTNQFFSVSQNLNLLGALAAIYINGDPHQISQADICLQTHGNIGGICCISRLTNHGCKFFSSTNDENAFRIYCYILKFGIGQIHTVPDRIILLGQTDLITSCNSHGNGSGYRCLRNGKPRIGRNNDQHNRDDHDINGC